MLRGCLNRRHMSILPELVSPGVINHFNDKDEIGIEAFTRAVQRITGIFPDGRFVIEDIVASGNNVAAHWSMTAINSAPIAGNPATGRTVTERAVVFYRFEGEKIAEVWLQVDQIGLFRQLGIKELAIDGQISAQTPH
nr:ester cyclase [Terriglobus albidus]